MAKRIHGGFGRSAANARPLPAAGGVLLAGADDTGGQFTLIHTIVPPHDSVPLHQHTTMNESFYVIDGSLTLTCGDDEYGLKSGGFAFLPRLVPHQYVAGADGAEILIHSSPGGLERFFDDWEAGMSLDELQTVHEIEFLKGDEDR